MAETDSEDGEGAGGGAKVDAESHRTASGTVGANCHGAGSGGVGGDPECEAVLRHWSGVERHMGL